MYVNLYSAVHNQMFLVRDWPVDSFEVKPQSSQSDHVFHVHFLRSLSKEKLAKWEGWLQGP